MLEIDNPLRSKWTGETVRWADIYAAGWCLRRRSRATSTVFYNTIGLFPKVGTHSVTLPLVRIVYPGLHSIRSQ